MITIEKIKALLKVVNPKNFSEVLQKIHYIKDKNVFVATDSYVLLEIWSPFLFDKDFSISVDDLKKIKKDIADMKLEWDILTIEWKDWKHKMVVYEWLFPDYEFLFEWEKYEISWLKNTISYSKFFDVALLLWIETIQFKKSSRTETMIGEKYSIRLVSKIAI